MIFVPHKPKRNRRRRTTNPKSSSESKEDRVSDLPDSIIYHILSFLKTKQVFQSCVLSTRWNHLTKHLPTLKLFSEDFTSSDGFTKSMSQILSVRDDSTPLPALHFHDDHGFVESEVFESIVEYAVSHRVQLLGITISRDDIQRFPSCLFSSQTLTSLHLTVGLFRKILFPNSLNCPTLTTLTLRSFYFDAAGDDGCAEPFSSFNRLHTLVIHNFRLLPDAQILCISSTTLVNLTISGHGFSTNHSYVCKLSSPTLCNFSYTGMLYQKPFCTDLYSVKHIYIDGGNIHHSIQHYSAILLSWLLELTYVKSLTISSNTLQILSFVPDLFKVKFPSLCNLESLQVKMIPLDPFIYLELRAKYMNEGGNFYMNTNTFIPNGVVDFLLQNSPSAKVNIIPFNYEVEIRARRSQEYQL